MKVSTETYLMKVSTETYLMKVSTETYLMKVSTETYLMKVSTETRRTHLIWYLRFYSDPVEGGSILSAADQHKVWPCARHWHLIFTSSTHSLAPCQGVVLLYSTDLQNNIVLSNKFTPICTFLKIIYSWSVFSITYCRFQRRSALDSI